MNATPLNSNENGFFFDCGLQESLEFLDHNNEKFSWSWKKFPEDSEGNSSIDFAVLQSPIPIAVPDSSFRSKRPSWTIDDYARQIRRRNLASFQKRRTVETLKRIGTATQVAFSTNFPLWFDELLISTTNEEGPYTDSIYLRNCLAVAQILENNFLFCHPVGNKQNVLLLYHAEVDGDRFGFGAKPRFIAERHCPSSIDQVDAAYSSQDGSGMAKIAFKTETDLDLMSINLNRLASDELEISSPSYHHLISSSIVDFIFEPLGGSELAYLTSIGELCLLDLDEPTRPTTLHETTSGVEFGRGLAWNDHPRLLLIHDSSAICQIDARDGNDVSRLWSTSSLVDQISLIQPVPLDPNYVAIFTSHSVYFVDIRRPNATLNYRRHMMLVSPKFGAISASSEENHRLAFAAGRETCDVVACDFFWRESVKERGADVVRSSRAPFRLVSPDESILWLKSHEPTLEIQKSTMRRLRAPTRGFRLLPSTDDFVVPLILNDVGDVFYQVCGDRKSIDHVELYNRSTAKLWSNFQRQSVDGLIDQNPVDRSRDLSNADFDFQSISLDSNETGDCPLCHSRSHASGKFSVCRSCGLSPKKAKILRTNKIVGSSNDNVDPNLLDIISNADLEHESTRAIMEIFSSNIS